MKHTIYALCLTPTELDWLARLIAHNQTAVADSVRAKLAGVRAAEKPQPTTRVFP